MLEWTLSHWTEIFGFVTGVLCVFFAARRNILTFPLGLASSAVFVVVFFEFALYADAGLQVIYLALGVTGWVGWNRSRAVDNRAATIATPKTAVLVLAAIFVIATTVLTVVLVQLTDSTTALTDAATTIGSLIAQYMLNRRWIQSWFVWITVDVAYIALYAYKGLLITAALYLIFIGLCVIGYRTWRAAPHAPAASTAVLQDA